MFKKIFVLLAFATTAIAQTVYVPIGSTRQVQAANTFILAPNIIAEADTAKGQAAFDACAANNPNNTMVCETQRSQAIVADAQARFVAVFTGLYDGNTDIDGLLRANRLYFIKP